MARIFRQTYTKPLPAEAEVFTRKGKRYARFKDGRGKTVTAPVSLDGAKVIRETATSTILSTGTPTARRRRLPDSLTEKLPSNTPVNWNEMQSVSAAGTGRRNMSR